jgi:hypothetical protein
MPETVYQIDHGPGLVGGDTYTHRAQGFHFSSFAFTRAGYNVAKALVKASSFHRFLLDIPAESNIVKAKLEMTPFLTNPQANDFRLGLVPPTDRFGRDAPWWSEEGFVEHRGDERTPEAGIAPLGLMEFQEPDGTPIVSTLGFPINLSLLFNGADFWGIGTCLANNTGSDKTCGKIVMDLGVTAPPPDDTLVVVDFFETDESTDGAEDQFAIGARLGTSIPRHGNEFTARDLYTFEMGEELFNFPNGGVVFARLRGIPNLAPFTIAVLTNTNSIAGIRRGRYWGLGGGFNSVNYPCGGDLPLPTRSSQTNVINGVVPYGTGFLPVFSVGPWTKDVPTTWGDAGYAPDVTVGLASLIQQWVDAPFYEAPFPMAFVLDPFLPHLGGSIFYETYSAEDPTFGGWTLTIDYTPAALKGCTHAGAELRSAVSTLAAARSATRSGVGITPAVAVAAELRGAVRAGAGLRPAVAAGARLELVTGEPEAAAGLRPAVATAAEVREATRSGVSLRPAVSAQAGLREAVQTRANLRPAIAAGAGLC